MTATGTPAGLEGELSELREGWRQGALKIASDVKAEAQLARNGDLYWTQPTLPGGEAKPLPLDSYLYPGSLGPALFFALG
ncbi:MAG: hypothetical protein AAF368_07685, partial [Planctomycetota bacterium]